jgi:hypothetical protein
MSQNADIRATPGIANMLRIDHPTHSYCTFIFDNDGHLFVSSDWGIFDYGWGATGGKVFAKFLEELEVEYFLTKLETGSANSGGRLSDRHKEALTAHILIFQKYLRDIFNKS